MRLLSCAYYYKHAFSLKSIQVLKMCFSDTQLAKTVFNLQAWQTRLEWNALVLDTYTFHGWKETYSFWWRKWVLLCYRGPLCCLCHWAKDRKKIKEGLKEDPKEGLKDSLGEGLKKKITLARDRGIFFNQPTDCSIHTSNFVSIFMLFILGKGYLSVILHAGRSYLSNMCNWK